MKDSIGIAYIEGYGKGLKNSYHDEHIRLIYLYCGVFQLACLNQDEYPDYYKSEINEARQCLYNKGIDHISEYKDKLLDYIKKTDKSSFELSEPLLNNLRKQHHIFKVKHFIEALYKENYQWLIKTTHQTQLFLSFYDKNNICNYIYYILTNGKTVALGRATDNDIIFDKKHTRISRKHCMITCFDNHYYIEDLKSLYGTYVNDV